MAIETPLPQRERGLIFPSAALRTKKWATAVRSPKVPALGFVLAMSRGEIAPPSIVCNAALGKNRTGQENRLPQARPARACETL